MAIHIEDIVEHKGLTKQIDAGAMGMLFDNLQRSQYRYPMKSTVRELASNSIDATNEKRIALDILSGKSKVEDHYYVAGSDSMDETIRTNQGVYKDSSFNPDYYDPQWLSTGDNIVKIEYRVGADLQRDTLVIMDNGVGLGGSRLEGILKLGYSSKRLSKNPLGKFGLGAKVALSTGVPCYTMISRYNGEESVFTIYSGHVESAVPHIDLKTGLMNTKHMMSEESNNYEYYTRPTTRKNGTEIHVEVKKHMKQEVISAVQNQLLYFDDISLAVVDYDGSEIPYPVQAEVLIENSKIVISNNSQFSKPHIVVNRVSYGYLDFLEMEMEEKVGNIGIKVSPDEIEVSPSREDVIWSSKTKNTIIKRFKEVRDIASDYIAKELVEPDFLKWHNLCRAILTKGFNSSSTKEMKVLATLGKITDLQAISPAYSLDPDVKFRPSLTAMLPFLEIHHITRKSSFKGGKTVYKVDRESSGYLPSSTDYPIFIKQDKFSFRKDMYLLSAYPDGFYTITFNRPEELPALMPADIKAKAEAERARQQKLYGYLTSSAGIGKTYHEVEVPESYSVKETDEEDDIEIELDASGEVVLSDKERRELEGKIVARTLKGANFPNDYTSRDERQAVYTHATIEIDPQDIPNIKQSLYYTTSSHTELMHLAAFITRHGNNERTPCDYTDGGSTRAQPYWGDFSKIRLLEISSKNERYFAHNWAHITSFFHRFENGIISMSNELIQWNTARILDQYIEQLKFLRNFSNINPEIAEKYGRLETYHNSFHRGVDHLVSKNVYGASESAVDTLVKHLDKVNELQLFTINVKDATAIATKVKELFPEEGNPESVSGAAGLDLEIYALLNELLDYAAPIHTLLNTCSVLTNSNQYISLEQELEIKSYITFKTT